MTPPDHGSPDPDDNGWPEYRRLVLDKLDVIDGRQKALIEKVGQLQVDMATVKTEARVRAGIIGGISAAIISVVLFLIDHLTFQRK